jgi:hypothetical protein
MLHVTCLKQRQPPCERVTGNLIDVRLSNSSVITSPTGAWPIVVGISLQQGMALQSALQEGKLTTLTITSPARTPTKVPIQFSETGNPDNNNFFAACMATGAFGALWSAHSSCSRAQILAAVAATAKPKVDSGLPDWEVKALYGKGLIQVRFSPKDRDATIHMRGYCCGFGDRVRPAASFWLVLGTSTKQCSSCALLVARADKGAWGLVKPSSFPTLQLQCTLYNYLASVEIRVEASCLCSANPIAAAPAAAAANIW